MATSFHISGSCDITFGTHVLGTTQPGGVRIRPKVTWNPVLVDKLGRAPAGHIYAGQSGTVEAALSEADTGRGFTKLVGSLLPGGLLGSLKDASGDPCLIGETALTAGGYSGAGSGICEQLDIEEKISGDKWTADLAFLNDPAELLLASTSEQVVPVTFIIIPNTDGVLFSTVPYL